ncbi:ABC transporter permease [Undibacter mobilis]|uniref:ABC transporter permease n=1 Tax=Undibacter mobilis TaxID=2292256 RepID=A0A371B9L4_9BRAD|nr:ABC transporter permease [Undibacter mobilis]RDV04299.1 ABC transporter permease [Undibacter mobilis]
MSEFAVTSGTWRVPNWLSSAWQRIGGFVVAICAILVIWQAAVTLLSIPEYILPGPRLVLEQWAANLPTLIANGSATASVIFLGYCAAIAVAIPLALSIAFFPVVARTIYPGIVMLQNVPKIAIAPLFIIWFGFGLLPKLLVVFLLAFFPIVVSSIAGFSSINLEIVDFARTTGASAFRIFRKVRLPAALPHVFVGLRIAATVAPTAAVVAEFVASDKGLGYLLLRYNGDLNTAMSFATIITLAIMGVSLYFIIELAERLIVPSRGTASGSATGT